MIKNVLSEIGGIAVYGILSICLFFGVFLAAIVLTALKRHSYLNHMSALPLEDDSETNTPSTASTSSHE